jgi:hypothetical protein
MIWRTLVQQGSSRFIRVNADNNTLSGQEYPCSVTQICLKIVERQEQGKE